MTAVNVGCLIVGVILALLGGILSYLIVVMVSRAIT